MKVAIITDTHFGVRNDSLPMQASMKKFLEHVFFPTLDEHHITRLIHGGDFFDRRKFVNFATARFVWESFAKPLADRGITQDVIVGNHDIYYREHTHLSSIDEMYRHTPIAVHANPTEIEIDGLGMLLLPWITESNRERSLQLLHETSCSIVLGHLEIEGFQMYRGMPSIGGFSPKLFDRFDLVMSGHYHHKSQQGPIQYLGAAWPMIWSDYKDSRGFHIFDTDTKDLTFIENPYSIFCRIVYDDADKKHDYIKELVSQILAKDSNYHDAYIKIVVQSKNQPYWFDLMMDALYKVGAQDIIVVDDIVVNDDETETEQSSPNKDTIALMREYLDSTTISCDKDELFAYLSAKYQEAIAASQSSRLV